MRNFSNVLDFYVRNLKNSEESEGVKFVFAGKISRAQFPLESYLVACSVKNSAVEILSSGRRLKANLCFDVYAHRNASKRDLSNLCHKLADRAEKVESDFTLDTLEVSEAVQDSDFCVWRQQIRLKLFKSDFTDNKASLKFLKNSEVILGVVEFREYESCEFYPVKELLSGVSFYEKTSENERKLRLSIKSETDLLGFEEFELYDVNSAVIYKGCRVFETSRKADESTGCVYEYGLVFSEKKEAEPCE